MRAETIQDIIEELEGRAKRSDTCCGPDGLDGWFLGNAFGLREAISLLRGLSTQPAPDTPRLAKAEAVLRDIANRPTTQRNPDGVEQAAEAMQVLARTYLSQSRKGDQG